MDNATHNRKVAAEAAIIDARVEALELCFIRKFPHLRLRPYRKRRLWKQKTTRHG